MNPLHAIITSRATAEIVTLLFAMARRSLHVREIARRSGLSEAMMRRELGRLAALGLVEALRYALRDPKIDLVIAHGPDVTRITEFGCPLWLLVVGTITRSKTLRLLGVTARDLGRRIEVDVVSPRDLARRLGPGAAGLPSPRVFVIGTERRLAVALARLERGARPEFGVFLGGNFQKHR